MTAAIDPDVFTRQTRGQETVDGLNDLQPGLVFLLFGGLGAFFFSSAGMNLCVRTLVWNRELAVLGLLGVLALFVLLTFGARRGVEYLRAQVLWKGRGQAVPLRVQVRWPAVAAVIGIVVILIVAALVLLPAKPLDLSAAMRALAAVSGLGTGILYVAMGRELSVRRLQWVGLAGGLLSTAIFFLPLDSAGSWLALGGAWGTTLFLSGGLALRRRLAEARPQHG